MLGAYVPINSPIATLPACAGALTAGVAGVSFDRFAWADPVLGLVSNTYTAGFTLGFVMPQKLRYARNGWNLAAWSNAPTPGLPPPAPSSAPATLILRQGMMVNLAVQGDFSMLFQTPTPAGAQVFASIVDGSAWTGVSGSGFIATQWTTMSACGPYGRALTSSYTPPII